MNKKDKLLIDKIKKASLLTVESIEASVGKELVLLGSGCFRSAYKISGTCLVVKIPFEQRKDDRCSLFHSRREIRAVTKVLSRKSLKHFRRYVPKIYFADYKTGIIVMEMLDTKVDPDKETEKVLRNMFIDTLKNYSSDVGCGNTGYDRRGQIKIIDWGCI
jgi:hypothetical protein